MATVTKATATTRICWNPTCPSEGINVYLLKCSKCREAMYCGVDCQRAHWGVHKATCIIPNSAAKVSSERDSFVDESQVISDQNELFNRFLSIVLIDAMSVGRGIFSTELQKSPQLKGSVEFKTAEQIQNEFKGAIPPFTGFPEREAVHAANNKIRMEGNLTAVFAIREEVKKIPYNELKDLVEKVRRLGRLGSPPEEEKKVLRAVIAVIKEDGLTNMMKVSLKAMIRGPISAGVEALINRLSIEFKTVGLMQAGISNSDK